MKNYRSYIKGVISKANFQAVQYNSNMVYSELTKWLREKNIKLEKEMFKAVLNTCLKLQKEYKDQGTVSIKDTTELMSMFFHTYTGADGIHTDSKLLKGYVKDFFPVIIKRMDEEKSLGNVALRMRKVDVVRVGKLFDAILGKINDDSTRDSIEKLMSDFCLNDLE